MPKIYIALFVASAVFMTSCNNGENTPAKAGTSDSAGIGHEKGKGTPYRGDSAARRIQSDTVSNK